tara:strand:- start:1126 stop:1293 length:168 start_codon:yes stop_codon:yes gene_type:complete
MKDQQIASALLQMLTKVSVPIPQIKEAEEIINWLERIATGKSEVKQAEMGEQSGS